MNTANVNSELVVDKDPNIVVATEIELQVRFVAEVRMGFEAKMLVTTTIDTL